MKKFTLLLMAIAFMGVSLMAQDSPEKMVKKADKAMSSFLKDPTGNIAKLTEAQNLLDAVLATDEGKSMPKAYLVQAALYNGEMTIDQVESEKAKITQQEYSPQYSSSAAKSMAAIQKAYMTAGEDKGALKKVVQLIYEGFGAMNDAGYSLYQNKDFAGSAKTFSGMLGLLDILKAQDEKSPFGNPEQDVNNLKYMAGVTSMFAEDNAGATKYLGELYNDKYDEPQVYSSLFTLYESDNPEKAAEVLAAGRERYPQDVSLLFSEINFYLKRGELNILVDKLEAAKTAEPDNASIYLTLGNVYDQLHAAQEDPVKKQEYFDLAMKEYEQAATVDPMSSDAHYSAGALYFNKAAEVSTAMNELPLNAQKEYQAKKVEFDGLMNKAEPFFKMAEKVNANDLNTLIALKELYATKGNYDLSNEFKSRIEKVQAGETLEGSYFK